MISLLLTLSLTLTHAPQESPQTELAFPAATPQSQGLSAEGLAKLTQELASYVERDMIVGAEMIVIQNRRTVLHEVFGMADREEEEAWRKETVCNIRSMTKPLTGAAAQILVDRGLLSLDDPVSKHLAGFDTDAARAITVRQVLTHRAGLPLTVLTTMDEYPTLVEMANAVGARGPEREPDSRFWYSDSGTDVLAGIVEVVSGKTIDRFVHDELLVPLGMTSSFYYLDGEDERRTQIASLYYGGVGKWRRFLDPDEGPFYPYGWGSQTLYSTPRDYAKFLAMWMDEGRVGEHVVLTKAAVERTLTPVSEMSMLGSEARFPTSFTGLEVYYGQMSVLHVPTDVKPPTHATIFGHSGSDGTIAWAWPERDLMILIFTQSRGSGAVLRIEEIIDRELIAPQAYENAAEVPEDLQPYLGTYIADWGSHMKEELLVQFKNGKLFLDVPSQMKFELNLVEAVAGEENDGPKWTFAIAPIISLWFDRTAEGTVNCLRINQGPLTFEAPRKGTPHQREFAEKNRPDAEALAMYLGHYDDVESGGQAEVFINGDYVAIRNEEGQLFHLWKVPVADVWQVRENPTVSITFQTEGDEVVSFTRDSVGGSKTVFPRAK